MPARVGKVSYPRRAILVQHLQSNGILDHLPVDLVGLGETHQAHVPPSSANIDSGCFTVVFLKGSPRYFSGSTSCNMILSMATPRDSYGSGSMEESKSVQFCVGLDLNDLRS